MNPINLELLNSEYLKSYAKRNESNGAAGESHQMLLNAINWGVDFTGGVLCNAAISIAFDVRRIADHLTASPEAR